MTKITEFSGDSSSSFSEDSKEVRVKKFAIHMLKSSLFIGTFLEKRFVEPLNSYRDVIKVSEEETDLIDNLKAVKKRCASYFPKNVWIGITEPKTIGAPAGYSLWVALDEEVFGSYWYKIKNVEFYDNEVRVKLEVVRPVKERTLVDNITSKLIEDVSQGDLSEAAVKFNNIYKDKLRKLLSETLNWSNIKATVIFMTLLITTLVTFLVKAIHYLLDYLLKLVHEISGLIKVCSPIIVHFMKLIMGTINGFYTLIAVMWRHRHPPQVNHNVYQITPYERPNVNMKALPYYQSGNFLRNRRLLP